MLYLKPTSKLVFTTENSEKVVTSFGIETTNYILFSCFELCSINRKRNKNPAWWLWVGWQHIAYTNLSWDCSISRPMAQTYSNERCVTLVFWRSMESILHTYSKRSLPKPILFEKSAYDITVTLSGGTPFPTNTNCYIPKARCGHVCRMQASIEIHLHFDINLLTEK